MNAREVEKCIDDFGTDIYRFCLKLCVDKTDAEDLYQQTFLKALETDWTLDWEKNPKALFFSLAYNLWKSDRRKQARRNRIAPCSSYEDEMATAVHCEENIEESYLQKEFVTEVRHTESSGKISSTIDIILFFRLFHRANSDDYKETAWYCEKPIVQGKKLN